MYTFYNQLQQAQTVAPANGYWAALTELTRRSPVQLLKNTLAWFLWG